MKFPEMRIAINLLLATLLVAPHLMLCADSNGISGVLRAVSKFCPDCTKRRGDLYYPENLYCNITNEFLQINRVYKRNELVDTIDFEEALLIARSPKLDVPLKWHYRFGKPCIKGMNFTLENINDTFRISFFLKTELDLRISVSSNYKNKSWIFNAEHPITINKSDINPDRFVICSSCTTSSRWCYNLCKEIQNDCAPDVRPTNKNCFCREKAEPHFGIVNCRTECDCRDSSSTNCGECGENAVCDQTTGKCACNPGFAMPRNHVRTCKYLPRRESHCNCSRSVSAEMASHRENRYFKDCPKCPDSCNATSGKCPDISKMSCDCRKNKTEINPISILHEFYFKQCPQCPESCNYTTGRCIGAIKNDSTNDKSGNSTIIYISVGAVAAFIIFVLICIFCIFKCKPKTTTNFRVFTKTEFLDFYKSLSASAIKNFSTEFSTLAMQTANQTKEQRLTTEIGKREENKSLNRYTNMLPYDQHLVKLQNAAQTYINASRIRLSHFEYIATQGPLTTTIGSFWQMVWEQRVANIIMLTRLEEKDKDHVSEKCNQYWPFLRQRLDLHAQNLTVTLTEEREVKSKLDSEYMEYQNFVPNPLFILRTLQLTQSSETRLVRQFQLVSWPDRGVPDQHEFHQFMQSVRPSLNEQRMQHPPAPILVHCSAGVGRTGVFIALHELLNTIHTERTFSIFQTVLALRQFRMNMVQKEIQYRFIFEYLAYNLDVDDVNANMSQNYLGVDSSGEFVAEKTV